MKKVLLGLFVALLLSVNGVGQTDITNIRYTNIKCEGIKIEFDGYNNMTYSLAIFKTNTWAACTYTLEKLYNISDNKYRFRLTDKNTLNDTIKKYRIQTTYGSKSYYTDPISIKNIPIFNFCQYQYSKINIIIGEYNKRVNFNILLNDSICDYSNAIFKWYKSESPYDETGRLVDSELFQGSNTNNLNFIVKDIQLFKGRYSCLIETSHGILTYYFDLLTTMTDVEPEQTTEPVYRYFDIFGNEIFDLYNYDRYFRLNTSTNKLEGILK